MTKPSSSSTFPQPLLEKRFPPLPETDQEIALDPRKAASPRSISAENLSQMMNIERPSPITEPPTLSSIQKRLFITKGLENLRKEIKKNSHQKNLSTEAKEIIQKARKKINDKSEKPQKHILSQQNTALTPEILCMLKCEFEKELVKILLEEGIFLDIESCYDDSLDRSAYAESFLENYRLNPIYILMSEKNSDKSEFREKVEDSPLSESQKNLYITTHVIKLKETIKEDQGEKTLSEETKRSIDAARKNVSEQCIQLQNSSQETPCKFFTPQALQTIKEEFEIELVKTLIKEGYLLDIESLYIESLDQNAYSNCFLKYCVNDPIYLRMSKKVKKRKKIEEKAANHSITLGKKHSFTVSDSSHPSFHQLTDSPTNSPSDKLGKRFFQRTPPNSDVLPASLLTNSPNSDFLRTYSSNHNLGIKRLFDRSPPKEKEKEKSLLTKDQKEIYIFKNLEKLNEKIENDLATGKFSDASMRIILDARAIIEEQSSHLKSFPKMLNTLKHEFETELVKMLIKVQKEENLLLRTSFDGNLPKETLFEQALIYCYEHSLDKDAFEQAFISNYHNNDSAFDIMCARVPDKRIFEEKFVESFINYHKFHNTILSVIKTEIIKEVKKATSPSSFRGDNFYTILYQKYLEKKLSTKLNLIQFEVLRLAKKLGKNSIEDLASSEEFEVFCNRSLDIIHNTLATPNENGHEIVCMILQDRYAALRMREEFTEFAHAITDNLIFLRILNPLLTAEIPDKNTHLIMRKFGVILQKISSNETLNEFHEMHGANKIITQNAPRHREFLDGLLGLNCR